MKVLSVVTVTFNAERTIEKTLQSVLSQSARGAIEYIVVDGASRDKTLDLIAPYRSQIDHLVTEPDHGIFDAMNKAAQLATTPWIVFMNAGDSFVDADTVASLLPQLSAHADGQTIIYGDCIRIWPDGRQELRRADPYYLKRRCIPGIGICHQSIYMPSALLRSHPFRWQQFPHCADLDLVHRLRSEGCSMLYEPRPLCLYAYGEGFSSNAQAARQVMDENARILGLRHSWIYYKQRLWQLFRK